MAVFMDAARTIVNVYNSLLRWNKEMTKLEPDLAESYTALDDSTYIFKIRKGIRFHSIDPVNGREMTAEDVKYSIERMMGRHGQKALFLHRARLEGKIALITTPDKYTVIFKTHGPYAPFLNYLASYTTSIVPKEAVEKFGDLKNQAIGTGPFSLREWVKGSHITLERNPTYFKKGLPYLDGIKIGLGMSLSSFMSAVLSGSVDFTGIFPQQISTLREKVPGISLLERRYPAIVTLRVSPWLDDRPPKPPFDKIEVRRAIAMAIDKKRLVKLAMDGQATDQVGIIANWPPYSLTERDQVEFNPQKAKQFLGAAGYAQGFSAELLIIQDPNMVKIGTVLQEMLKEVGIQIEIKALPTPQFLNRIYKFDYQMSIQYMGSFDDPGQGLTANFGRNAQFYRWKNEEIWDLVDAQSKIMDSQKRAAMLQDIQRKLIADSPCVFLMTIDNHYAFQPWVFPKDVRQNIFGDFFFEETWMAKK
jgi:peptide/nickel transport system substrate-binding protein